MEASISPINQVFQLEEILEIILEFVVEDGRIDNILCIRPVSKLWKKVCFKLFLKLGSFPLKLNLRMNPKEQTEFLCNITTHSYIPMEVELSSNGVIEPQELMLLEMYAGNIVIVTFAGEELVGATESLLSPLSLPRLKLVHLELPEGKVCCLAGGQLAFTIDDVMTSKEGVKLRLFVYCLPRDEEEAELENSLPSVPKFPSLKGTGMRLDFNGPCQSNFRELFANLQYIETLTVVDISIMGEIRNKDVFTVIAKRVHNTVKTLYFTADVLEEPPVAKFGDMSKLERLCLTGVTIDTTIPNASLPDLLPKLRFLTVSWIDVIYQIPSIQRLGKDARQFLTVKKLMITSVYYDGNYDVDNYAASLVKMLDNFPNLEELTWFKITDLLAFKLLPYIFRTKTQLTYFDIVIDNPNKFPVMPVYNLSDLLTGYTGYIFNEPVYVRESSILNLTGLRKLSLALINLDTTIDEAASEALLSMKKLTFISFKDNVKVFPVFLDSLSANGKEFQYAYNDSEVRDSSDEDESDYSDIEVDEDFERLDPNDELE